MSIDVSSLRIITYPSAALRRKAGPVDADARDVRAVAERMVTLMREAEGIGLAAPQVALSWRLFVTEVDDNGEDRSASADPPSATRGPMVFVNPRLVGVEGAPEPLEEGCLSLAEIKGEVLRPPIVTVEATDIDGARFTLRCGGLLARCVQHEMDHLDGVLIIDRMTQMSRLKTRTAVKALEKAARA